MTNDIDPYLDLKVVTEAELLTLPEGLYLVGDVDGQPIRREIGHPARLLARVRTAWLRTPRAMHKVLMRKDGLQIVQQWDDREGGWPEDGPPDPPATIEPPPFDQSELDE
jgi:hypothetical protein